MTSPTTPTESLGEALGASGLCSAHQEPCHQCYSHLVSRALAAEAEMEQARESLAGWELEARSLAADVIRAWEHGRLSSVLHPMFNAATRIKNSAPSSGPRLAAYLANPPGPRHARLVGEVKCRCSWPAPPPGPNHSDQCPQYMPTEVDSDDEERDPMNGQMVSATVGKASSGEAAGDGVTHAEAVEILRQFPAGDTLWRERIATLWRYIDQQEQAEREAAELKTKLDNAHRAYLADVATIQSDRDAERAQKEALQSELETARRITACPESVTLRDQLLHLADAGHQDLNKLFATEDERDALRAERDELKAKLRERDVCWHCKDLLLEPDEKPRCQSCPREGDCDDAACSEDGCREARAAEQPAEAAPVAHTCTATATLGFGGTPPPCPACLADPTKFTPQSELDKHNAKPIQTSPFPEVAQRSLQSLICNETVLTIAAVGPCVLPKGHPGEHSQ